MASLFFLLLGLLDIVGAIIAIIAFRMEGLQTAATFILMLIILKGLWTVVTSRM